MTSQMTSLQDLVDSQRSLEAEASAALPWAFDECTYGRGYIRQPVFLCLTCATPRGMCAACSIACHGEHEQVELFPKRAFRCDCPTTALSHPCALLRPASAAPHPPNEKNTYNQNYENRFCRCGRRYVASEEQETMIQCLACEDWYHESCLHLRDPPPPLPPISEPPTSPPTTDQAPTDPAPNGHVDEDEDEDDEDGLPPSLLPEGAYDVLICASCVRKSDVLKRWAGSKGVLVVAKEGEGEWKVMSEDAEGAEDGDVDVGDEEVSKDEEAAGVESREGEAKKEVTDTSASAPALTDASPTLKRPLPSSPSSLPSRPTKRPRPLCHAPPPEGTSLSQRIFSSPPSLQSEGDVFLTSGWRARWCQCADCLPQFEGQEYLLREEETWEPPEDPDSGLSIEELGMRLLDRLPRAQVIDGILAYNDLRDRLSGFLRRFVQEGKEVGREDVEGFFRGLVEEKVRGR